MAKNRFCLMFRITAWLRFRAFTMPCRSPLTRVMPALSMATSVPVPMAIPTSAPARAGASLMPSPATATVLPSACSLWTSLNLSSGIIPALKDVRWRSAATAPAVTGLSPVSMTTSIPCLSSCSMADPLVSLMRSPMATKPTTSPSTDRKETVFPCFRCPPASRFMASVRPAPARAIISSFPRAAFFPLTIPSTPIPLTARNPSASGASIPRALPWATVASARGCSLIMFRETINCSTRSSEKRPEKVPTAATEGLPSVRVPVLSTTRVSTLFIFSRASASRINTPFWAPFPTPTITDMGVARPRAHGQAMISTAMALTRAYT